MICIYANNNPSLLFFIPYTVGRNNLNNYTALEMAELFMKDILVPQNIIFEKDFFGVTKYMDKLDYSDIHLISRHISTIESRDQISTSIDFCGHILNFPILAAPMADVCDGFFADQIYKLGGLGFIHRFQPIEYQISDFKHCSGKAGCAIGINGDWELRFKSLLDVGCDIFLVDVANGASKIVGKTIETMQAIAQKVKIHIVAGNIGHVSGLAFLNKLGISWARVGIAGGAACSTKIATGIYTPMFSTLYSLYTYKVYNNLNIKLIADGNIKIPADLCKAMCVADIAMAGSIFAGTEEAPGNVIKNEGKMYKIFRGSASYSNQKYEAQKEPKYVEGLETLVPYAGPLSKVVDSFNNGLKSCMSYMDARNLVELKNKYSYIK